MSQPLPSTIAIGSDHAGFELKQRLIDYLTSLQVHIVDYGPFTAEPTDYADIAAPLAEAVVDGQHRLGVVICSNGVGVSIAANKVRGARAALCADAWSARRARQHTDCNVLALGAYVTSPQTAFDIVDSFLSAEFEGGRHVRRIAKLAQVEERHSQSDATERANDPQRTAEFSPMA